MLRKLEMCRALKEIRMEHADKGFLSPASRARARACARAPGEKVWLQCIVMLAHIIMQRTMSKPHNTQTILRPDHLQF